jgi:RNA polymerase sigma-70 factor (ECF subfamily)
LNEIASEPIAANQRKWKKLQFLFSKYLQNDASATGELFHGLMEALRGYFHVRIQSDEEAEDLLQTTLLKIHFARDRFDHNQSLKTWIFTIASRSLIDHWRGYSSGHEGGNQDFDEIIDSIPSQLLDPAMKTELQRDLKKALEKLKPIDRSIVFLYVVEGFSMAEIGEALSITESAAKLRAHRAYKDLRSTLGSSLVAMIFYKWFLG